MCMFIDSDLASSLITLTFGHFLVLKVIPLTITGCKLCSHVCICLPPAMLLNEFYVFIQTCIVKELGRVIIYSSVLSLFGMYNNPHYS